MACPYTGERDQGGMFSGKIMEREERVSTHSSLGCRRRGRNAPLFVPDGSISVAIPLLTLIPPSLMTARAE